MREDTLKYIDAEHLPRRDFVLDTPRNMNIARLREFFAHIAEREKTFEIEKVFLFKYVEASRKKHQDDEDEDDEEEEGFPEADRGAGGTEHGSSPTGAAPAPANSAEDPHRNEEHDNANSTGDAAPPAPPTNHNAVMPKKKRKTANVSNKKQPKKTQHQEPSVHPGGDTAGAEVSTRPRPKPRPVTRPGNGPTNTRAEDTPTQAPAHSSGDTAGAEVSTRPRPKPRPVTRPANEPGNTRTDDTPIQAPNTHDNPQPPNGAELALKPRPEPRPVTRPATESTSSPAHETYTHAPGTHNNPQAQPQERVPDAVIDPSLLAASNQPSRVLVNTSDNLALQEASRFAVTGKRVPKKKNHI